jgi:hypothetical protein
VARRGEYPQVPDRIGPASVLLGEIDPFTGLERACGNALGSHSRSSRSPRRWSWSPGRRDAQNSRPLQEALQQGALTRGESLFQETPIGAACRRGARESVVRSRPVEPGASRYPASARTDSSIACLESRHRALLLAEEELGVQQGGGRRRDSSIRCRPKWVRQLPYKTRG